MIFFIKVVIEIFLQICSGMCKGGGRKGSITPVEAGASSQQSV